MCRFVRLQDSQNWLGNMQGCKVVGYVMAMCLIGFACDMNGFGMFNGFAISMN